MTDNQLTKSIKLFKAAIHADIIEAVITQINPIRNIKDQKLMMAADKLRKSASEFRKAYGNLNPEFEEKLGEIIDIVDDEINKQFK